MPGTLITGPEPLQSWWLPDEASRKNGWGGPQRYEQDESRRKPSSPSKKKKTSSPTGYQEVDEKSSGHHGAEHQESQTTPKSIWETVWGRWS